jgi:SHS2 domain-containing protein
VSAGSEKRERARSNRGPLGPFLLSSPSVSVPTFEILEHPADVGFRAFGNTRTELFANAAMALMSIAADIDDVRPVHEYPLTASAPDPESLLVAWLSEVLYWVDGRRILFRNFRVMEMNDSRLTAIGLGEPHDPARHHARLIVKAVTWHQLKIAQSGGRWIAEVYLDV